MINDFPKLTQYTSEALFADDCTIWRSGTNIVQILYHLQEDLDIISRWVKKWGLSINIDKSTAIVFTKSKINIKNLTLKIDQIPIVFTKTCKLLGVTFDSRLTWEPHIETLIQKTTKGLNIMRCISGTNWGSNKDTLTIIYKSLILSQLDYCSFVYDGSAISNLKRLDTIQYKALLIATGGIRGTSLNALLGECSEIPLKLRRQSVTLKYLLKLYNNSANSAHLVLCDRKYFQLELVCKSKYKEILNEFSKKNNILLSTGPNPAHINHFNENNNQIDINLLETYFYGKQVNKFEALCKIDSAIETLESIYDHILFADASINNQGKVGAAIYIPSLSEKLSIQLPQNLSIYYAEAYAILQSLNLATKYNFSNYYIISDNAKVLTDIKFSAYQNSPHPLLIHEIQTCLQKQTNSKIIIKWMPGHCNHPYLDNIDILAKKATTSSNFHNIEYSKYEATLIIDSYIWTKWFKQWETNPSGSYQNTYIPTNNTLNTIKSRKKDVIKNRLRMLHTKLNSGLCKLGIHPNGKCDVCGVEESAQHFVLHCIKTEQIREEIKAHYPEVSTELNYQRWMSNSKVVEKIIDFVIIGNMAI